jgi:hypothetical protein
MSEQKEVFRYAAYTDFTTETECLLRGKSLILSIIHIKLNFQRDNPPPFTVSHSRTETENFEVSKIILNSLYIRQKINTIHSFMIHKITSFISQSTIN